MHLIEDFRTQYMPGFWGVQNRMREPNWKTSVSKYGDIMVIEL